MDLRTRITRTVGALALALAAAASANATNTSNYIHLINGIDHFYGIGSSAGAPGTGPSNGAFRGVWRCFPSKMLHAPTLSSSLTGYATKVNSIHIVVGGSSGTLLQFPVIALSSSQGECRFLASSGSLNFGLMTAPGFGTFIGGPLESNQGPTTVSFLGGVTNLSVINPAPAPNVPVKIAFRITGGTIDVPEYESLTLWVQDGQNQFGAGSRQYWTESIDERNLCSGYSFLLDGAGVAHKKPPNEEWGIGFGTVDATLSAAITSLGPGPTSMNAHHTGFAQPFDQGSGARTISITGSGGTGLGAASLGSEILGFSIYDELDAGYGGAPGSYQVLCANLWGLDITGQPACSRRAPTFQTLPTGGPGGPVIGAIPEMPRSVGKIDSFCSGLASNALWIAATNICTPLGGSNCPYFPVPAGNSGSSGNTGGFFLPVPNQPNLVGLQVFFWSFNVDPTNMILDHTADGGHHLTNGFDVLFFP